MDWLPRRSVQHSTAQYSTLQYSLSRQVVFDMMSVQPDVTLQLAMSVISNISSYVRSIDFALDWVLIESGHALYRQVLCSTVQYSTV